MTQKTVLITGASSGIGKALCYKFASENFNVILMARRIEILNEVANDLKTKYPKQNFLVQKTDLTNPQTHQSDLESVLSQIDNLDIVIANAGIGSNTDGRQDFLQDNLKTYTVNLLSTITTLEVCKSKMLKQNHGHLVAVSSVAGYRGLPLSSSYCGSKSGLTTHLESLRIDLNKHNIPVTVIEPGFIDTEMTKENGKMPWLMPAEKAANKIYNAILSKKKRFTFPWQMNVMMTFVKHLPNFIYDWAMKRSLKRAEVFKKNR